MPILSAWLAPRTQFTRATDFIFVTKVPVKESDPAGVHRYILQSQRATQAVISLMHLYEASEADQKAREAEQRHLARQERIMQALQQFEAAYAAEIRTEPTKDQAKKMLGSTVDEVEKQFRSAFVGVGVICLILLLLFASLIIPIIIVVAIIYALRRREKSRAA